MRSPPHCTNFQRENSGKIPAPTPKRNQISGKNFQKSNAIATALKNFHVRSGSRFIFFKCDHFQIAKKLNTRTHLNSRIQYRGNLHRHTPTRTVEPSKSQMLSDFGKMRICQVVPGPVSYHIGLCRLGSSMNEQRYPR
jgi:hypothetical protein